MLNTRSAKSEESTTNGHESTQRSIAATKGYGAVGRGTGYQLIVIGYSSFSFQSSSPNRGRYRYRNRYRFFGLFDPDSDTDPDPDL